MQHAWTADPDLIRSLDVGQACYICRGGATFVQVARPELSPLSLPAARSPTVIIAPPVPPPTWPWRLAAVQLSRTNLCGLCVRTLLAYWFML